MPFRFVTEIQSTTSTYYQNKYWKNQKHRLRSANSAELEKTSNTNVPIRDIKSADKVTKSFENGHLEKLNQSNSDLNANVIIKSQSPVKKKVEIKEKKTFHFWETLELCDIRG
jgi:hypothetical protein